jgi:hypothetical protein
MQKRATTHNPAVPRWLSLQLLVDALFRDDWLMAWQLDSSPGEMQ